MYGSTSSSCFESLNVEAMRKSKYDLVMDRDKLASCFCFDAFVYDGLMIPIHNGKNMLDNPSSTTTLAFWYSSQTDRLLSPCD